MNITNFLKSTKGLFLGLLICFGVFSLLPLLSYQPFLAQGDHGLNLYCFQQTALGKIPSQDFWWPYGPFMPYYFASLINLFNDSMGVIFFGRIIFYVLASVFCYLTLSLYFHPLLCFAAGVWLWAFHPDFFYTYNHFGAITLFFAIAFCVIFYIKHKSIKSIYWALFCAFLINLIRINMGLAIVGGIAGCYLLIGWADKDFKTKEIVSLLLFIVGLFASTALIYWFLFHNLTAYQIKQTLPYFDQVYYNASFTSRISDYIKTITENIHVSKPANFALAIFTVLFIGKLVFFFKPKTEAPLKREIILIFLSLLILWVFVSHEFFLGTHAYRIIWMKPFQLLLLFFVIGFATNNLSSIKKTLIYFMLLLIASQSILQMQQKFRRDKLPFYYLAHPKAELYVSNDPFWSETVFNTAQYLENNLAKDELFFALPFDPLYYYLTDRPSPVWELIFFKATNVTEEQERRIIEDLEKKKVRWILLSNRIFSPEEYSGKFGIDYVASLASYIDKHYKAVAQFGDWKALPGWNNYHATRILRRVD